jgi:hypothetical protein
MVRVRLALKVAGSRAVLGRLHHTMVGFRVFEMGQISRAGEVLDGHRRVRPYR